MKASSAMSVVTVVVCVALLCCCYPLGPLGAFPSDPVPHTAGFMSNSYFDFTISPNDRWLVLFKGHTEDQLGTRHERYGNLCLFDLTEKRLHGKVGTATTFLTTSSRRNSLAACLEPLASSSPASRIM